MENSSLCQRTNRRSGLASRILGGAMENELKRVRYSRWPTEPLTRIVLSEFRRVKRLPGRIAYGAEHTGQDRWKQCSDRAPDANGYGLHRQQAADNRCQITKVLAAAATPVLPHPLEAPLSLGQPVVRSCHEGSPNPGNPLCVSRK